MATTAPPCARNTAGRSANRILNVHCHIWWLPRHRGRGVFGGVPATRISEPVGLGFAALCQKSTQALSPCRIPC